MNRFVPLLCLCFAQFAMGPAQCSRGDGFTEIVVFGDSLSDTGNVLRSTQSTLLVEDRPAIPWYDQGRWTNGARQTGEDTLPLRTLASGYEGVWHEQLAHQLGIPPATASLQGGNNWAYGGALTTNGTFTLLAMQNIGEQVVRFLQKSPTIDAQQLFAVWGGANDVRDAAFSPNADASTVEQAAVQAVDNLTQSVRRLTAAGAQQIVWPNLPPLDLLPEAASLPQPLREALRHASERFRNDQLTHIATLQSEFPAIAITPLDVFALLDRAVQHPSDFGFTNVSQGVITSPSFGSISFRPVANFPDLRVDTDSFLFWDQLHPTARTHALIAQEAYRLVPEPIAWHWTLATIVLLSVRHQRQRQVA